MIDFEPEMKKIFGSGVPDDYLKLKRERGNSSPNRGITNERQAIIKEFHDRLAPAYKKFKGKDLSAKVLALKLAHLNQLELYTLLNKCMNSKNFGACFWGSLKLSTPLIRHNLKKKI